MLGEEILSWKVGKASENVIVYEGYRYSDCGEDNHCYITIFDKD